MKVKVESEKLGLRFNIQKNKIMASGPITSWQIDGETVADFVFWGSKITADGDFSHEIKRRLLLGRKLDLVKYPNIFTYLDPAEFLSFNLSNWCHRNARFQHPVLDEGDGFWGVWEQGGWW